MVSFWRRERWMRRGLMISSLSAAMLQATLLVRAGDQPPVQRRQGFVAQPLVPPPSNVTQVRPAQIPRRFETDVNKVSQTLDQLIRDAIARNPDLAASREKVSAAEHRIAPAGMPEDPYIGYRMKDLPTTFSMTSENATEKQAQFQQRYPFPGKLSLREGIAARQAAGSREQMHAAMTHLVAQVRSAFADVFLADKDIEISLERQRRLRDLVDIATSKYKVGPGLQQDVLNADVALARLDSLLIELSRRRTTREIQLATLLNRDTVEIPPLGVLPAVALGHSVPELEQMVLETNPGIRERERELERDQFAVRLARMAPLPDMVIGGAYGSREDPPDKITPGKNGAPAKITPGTDRPDLLTAEIVLDFPVFYYWKQSEQLQEAGANLRRSKARLDAAKRKAIDGLHDLLARLSQHEQVAASFRNEVIPVASAAVNASVSAYQVNKVDFLTLLAAQDNLDNYQIEYWRNEGERFRDLAQIDEVTGAVLLADGWKQ
jgi:outer membrane protein, heavy metal efflux system